MVQFLDATWEPFYWGCFMFLGLSSIERYRRLMLTPQAGPSENQARVVLIILAVLSILGCFIIMLCFIWSSFGDRMYTDISKIGQLFIVIMMPYFFFLEIVLNARMISAIFRTPGGAAGGSRTEGESHTIFPSSSASPSFSSSSSPPPHRALKRNTNTSSTVNEFIDKKQQLRLRYKRRSATMFSLLILSDVVAFALFLVGNLHWATDDTHINAGLIEMAVSWLAIHLACSFSLLEILLKALKAVKRVKNNNNQAETTPLTARNINNGIASQLITASQKLIRSMAKSIERWKMTSTNSCASTSQGVSSENANVAKPPVSVVGTIPQFILSDAPTQTQGDESYNLNAAAANSSSMSASFYLSYSGMDFQVDSSRSNSRQFR